MINFNSIKRTETDDIVDIIKEKNKGVKKSTLIELQEVIISRYNKYIEIEELRRFANISFTEEQKDALQSLYSSKTVTAKKITEEILDSLDSNHSDLCLYCGIGEIDQIDHFLPQEYFPEYSILHKNLIPICGKCNQIKGDKIAGIDGVNYIHAIFDKLPIESYLNCKITYDNDVPTVKFSINSKFTSTTVDSHFQDLKLNKRIEKKSVQYFLQIKALKEKFGISYANTEIERDLIKVQYFFNDFFWKTELIKEMQNTDFVNKIE